MQPLGIHHLTAITANAAGCDRFYTETLGLRRVKKTVNQDDVSAYHLFYADGRGSPGTDLTFFDWPAARERRGVRSISRTGLRVARPSLAWWQGRLERLGVSHRPPAERDGRLALDLEDPEGQRLSLVEDGAAGPGFPWEKGPVPPEHQIRGLGPVTLSVPQLGPTEEILVEVLGLRKARSYRPAGADSPETAVFEMATGGPAAELHVALEPRLPLARQGAGGVHHVAFRIPDDAYSEWTAHLARSGVSSSGPVDRYYFRSLYFREPAGILFELATDGPGFARDEPLDALGQRLALPPFLEPRRQEIEQGLKPLA